MQPIASVIIISRYQPRSCLSSIGRFMPWRRVRAHALGNHRFQKHAASFLRIMASENEVSSFHAQHKSFDLGRRHSNHASGVWECFCQNDLGNLAARPLNL